ncbi:MAG: HD domain-containing protein [Polyangiaceae bacterium]
MTPNPLWPPDLYIRVARFAAEAHQGQKVPGTELPYLLHACLVAAEVQATLTAEVFVSPDLAIACALLHDTIEDTAVTREQVAAAFGEPVAAGVSALSKDPSLPKREAMKDSLQRIQAQPPEVWLVKLADRTVNLAPPPHYWSPEKIAAYREEAILIADTLAPASPVQTARLRRRIEQYPQTPC